MLKKIITGLLIVSVSSLFGMSLKELNKADMANNVKHDVKSTAKTEKKTKKKS